MTAPTIFQIEDDEDFSFFMHYAIDEINQNISLVITPNGSHGLGLLARYQEKNQTPGMILLDINLPGISGMEVLKLIRNKPEFSGVPIIIFSTSDNPKDIKNALDYGATEFQTKPLGYRELVNSLKKLHAKYIHN